MPNKTTAVQPRAWRTDYHLSASCDDTSHYATSWRTQKRSDSMKEHHLLPACRTNASLDLHRGFPRSRRQAAPSEERTFSCRTKLQPRAWRTDYHLSAACDDTSHYATSWRTQNKEREGASQSLARLAWRSWCSTTRCVRRCIMTSRAYRTGTVLYGHLWRLAKGPRCHTMLSKNKG